MAERETDKSKTDATKIDAEPTSTWGATPEAKEAWARKHGKSEKKDEK